jgi:hypothetical protein
MATDDSLIDAAMRARLDAERHAIDDDDRRPGTPVEPPPPPHLKDERGHRMTH